MRQKIERLRRKLHHAPRYLAGFIGAAALSACLLSTVWANRIVTVTDEDGGSQVLLTAAEHPEAIIQMAGMSTKTYDEVVYTNQTGNAASIVIRRAYPVKVIADGVTYHAEVLGGTVQDLLDKFNITLGEHDFTVPGLNTSVEAGTEIQVRRVTFAEESTRGEVAADAVDSYVAKLAETQPGVEFKPNKNHMYDITYRHRYEDGELVESEIVTLLPVITPRDAGSTEFLPGVPCSTIEAFEDISIGADGVPTTYTRKMESALATAYSSSGGKGSSGLGLYCGTVAVNPNVIPYGTRMYITSADNSFVYGFAIATDTGGAMMEGRIDVDLYFETNAECYRFGKRALDVYILD